MKINDVASRVSWQVADAAQPSRTITLNGWDFGGQGPLALLHHANGMCAAMWAQVAVQLTDNYRVFAMDARGHGDSAQLKVPDDYDWLYFANDVAEVARQLCQTFGQGQIAHGIGSSFGGIVTASAAADHPGLFARVTMLDPPIHSRADVLAALSMEVGPTNSERAGLVEQTLKRRDVWPDRKTAHAAWRDKPLFAPWQDAAFDLYVEEGMRELASGEVQLKCSPQVEAHIFQTTGDLGVLDYAPRVAVPVTLVHARRGFFAADFFRGVTTLFPHNRFLQLDAGHMLPLEVPDLVVDVLLDRE